MKPDRFSKLAEQHGAIEKYKAGEIFHAQNFPKKLFLLKKGYVKRYQSTNPEQKVLELIYGPGHLISLSQLYKELFDVDQNEDSFIYIYQTMTDVEMLSLNSDFVIQQLEEDPSLYRDFFYESGLKLRSNILRLASNSIKDDYKKVAHQIASLAHEFADMNIGDTRKPVELPLPQSSVDIAEQLNISKDVTEAVLNNLSQHHIIKVDGSKITILNFDLLKDVYL